MNKLNYIIILLLTCRICNAQNLVPNPSFEDTINCPFSANQLSYCEHWNKYRETPDYFNSCAGVAQTGVPDNFAGYQNAHTGNAYGGGYSIFYGMNNLREILGCRLNSPMIIGQKYFVSFFVNFGGKINCRTAINKIGVLFYTDSSYYNYPNILPNFAHIYTDSVITDSTSWTFIKGFFIADSAYAYLGLGCFFNINNVDTINLNGNISSGYYFYDDICVSTDSLTCYVSTGIIDLERNTEFNFFPNPFHDKLNIQTENDILLDITLFDITSRKLLQQKFTSSVILNTEKLAKGVYIYEVRDKNGLCKKGKVVKE